MLNKQLKEELEYTVNEFAAYLKKRKQEKRRKFAAAEKKLRADRYKLTPSELKDREENLERHKEKARKIQLAGH